MGTIYGVEIRERGDKYHQMLERMTEVAEAILLPWNFPVETFPVLHYLPSWFPGGGFKMWAQDAKRDIAYIVNRLFDDAKDLVSSLRRCRWQIAHSTWAGPTRQEPLRSDQWLAASWQTSRNWKRRKLFS